MPVIPIDVGNKITAEQFNELVSTYDSYWSGASYTFDAAHSSDLVRRKGWGQPSVVPVVSQYEEITALHTNKLISQINAGLWHIDETLPGLMMSRRAISTAISATFYTATSNILNTTIDTNKFLVDAGSSTLTSGVSTLSSSNLAWQDDLYSEHKFTFASYNAARHFFNGGGQLTVDMSNTSGGLTMPCLIWNEFFSTMGMVRIGADQTIADGSVPYTNAIGNKGFYSINALTGDYTVIYDIQADINTAQGGVDWPNVYSAGDAYSSYGAYTQRRFAMYIKGAQNGSSFDIYIKIELIEDPEDTSPVNNNVVASLGYKVPEDTPDTDTLSSSTNTYFKSTDVSPAYIYIAPAAPTIVTTAPWSAVNL